LSGGLLSACPAPENRGDGVQMAMHGWPDDLSLQESATASAESSEQLAERFRRRLLRLAADVHDGPMQDLTVIGFGLHDLRQQLESTVPAERRGPIDASFNELLSECELVERSLRALVSSLEGGLAESVSLAEAIGDEVDNFKRRCPVGVELIIDGDPEAETDSQRIALQAVTREALSNVARHAEATLVRVSLRAIAGGIELSVRDDGQGFDVEASSAGTRLGLSGMRTRIALLGGELRVESVPGGPTNVTATLQPWRPAAA
jgi:signal transduction histidine kinase